MGRHEGQRQRGGVDRRPASEGGPYKWRQLWRDTWALRIVLFLFVHLVLLAFTDSCGTAGNGIGRAPRNAAKKFAPGPISGRSGSQIFRLPILSPLYRLTHDDSYENG